MGLEEAWKSCLLVHSGLLPLAAGNMSITIWRSPEQNTPHEEETSHTSLPSLDLPTANMKVKNLLDSIDMNHDNSDQGNHLEADWENCEQLKWWLF